MVNISGKMRCNYYFHFCLTKGQFILHILYTHTHTRGREQLYFPCPKYKSAKPPTVNAMLM